MVRQGGISVQKGLDCHFFASLCKGSRVPLLIASYHKFVGLKQNLRHPWGESVSGVDKELTNLFIDIDKRVIA